MAALGNIGSVGGEGSRGSPGTATSLVSDQPDTTRYHETPRGTIIPHRVNDDGQSPGFNHRLGLSQFRVVDVDTTPNAMNAVEHPPGALDAHGNKKEIPCTTNQTSEANDSKPTQTVDSGNPSDPAQPLEKTGRGSSNPRSRTGRPTQQQQLLELSKQVDSLVRALQTSGPTPHTPDDSLLRRLQSLEEKIDSLTSAMEGLPISKTRSGRSHPLTPSWMVELEGQFGRMRMEALAVDLREESTVVMLLDPAKPHMVPAKSSEPITLRLAGLDQEFELQVLPNGWSSRLAIAEQECLLVVMSVFEPDDES